MSSSYLSTQDLSARFRCTSRTLFRRMKRERNPFPAPCMRHAGSSNLWDADDVTAWEQRERLHAAGQPEQEDASRAASHPGRDQLAAP